MKNTKLTLCSTCKKQPRHRGSLCLECSNAYQREWARRNKDSRARSLRKDYETHKSRISSWRLKNQKRLAEQARERYLRNRAAIIERSRQRRLKLRAENIDAERAYNRSRMQQRRADADLKNRERANERSRQNRLWRSDPIYRVRKVMRTQLNTMFRRYALGANVRGKHWEDLLGYTGAQAIDRLRETIPPGYTWEDFLSGQLHIDHIFPIASFEIASIEDENFRRCWALDNLQLLPELENKSKGARLDHPSQTLRLVSA